MVHSDVSCLLQSPMIALYKRLFPVVMRLACDVEQVALLSFQSSFSKHFVLSCCIGCCAAVQATDFPDHSLVHGQQKV